MSKKCLIIVGAGGFGREVFEWALDDISTGNSQFEKIEFVDDYNKDIKNFRCTVSEFYPTQHDVVVIAIGKPSVRQKVANGLKSKNVIFGNLIHPSAIIASSSQVGDGFIACPFSLVSVDTKIGDHVHMNCMSSVGHDTVIGDYCTLSGHVDITGNCTIGESVFIGSGARLVPEKTICSGALIGAGTTIQKSIRKPYTYYHSGTRKL